MKPKGSMAGRKDSSCEAVPITIKFGDQKNRFLQVFPHISVCVTQSSVLFWLHFRPKTCNFLGRNGKCIYSRLSSVKLKELLLPIHLRLLHLFSTFCSSKSRLILFSNSQTNQSSWERPMRRGKPIVGPAGSSRQRNNGLLPKWALDLSEQLRIIKYPAPSKIQWKWVCLLPFSPVWALIQKCPFRFRTVASCGLRCSQDSPGTQPCVSPTARFGKKGLEKVSTRSRLNQTVQKD